MASTSFLVKEADVVIIGAGGAGLSAAVSAYEHGAKSVIIVEKMPFIGGNTLRAGGAYNAADPEVQKAQGIEDSIEKHIEQTYEGGHKVGNLNLVTNLSLGFVAVGHDASLKRVGAPNFSQLRSEQGYSGKKR